MLVCVLLAAAHAEVRAAQDPAGAHAPRMPQPPLATPGAGSDLESLRRSAPIATYRMERALYEHALAAARAAAERRGEAPPARVEGLVEPERPVVQLPVPGAPRVGPSQAGAEIIVIENFAQPASAEVDAELQRLRGKYGDDLALVHVDYVPSRTGSPGLDAAVAARCAQEQGKFWEYREQLLAAPGAGTMSDLEGHARKVALDASEFEKCLLRPGVRDLVLAGSAAVAKAGIAVTPVLLADGIYVEGDEAADVLDRLVAHRLHRELAPPPRGEPSTGP